MATLSQTAAKVLVPLPGWVEAMGRGGQVTDEASAFARVPLVYRALQLRCNALSDVPVHIKRGKTEVEWPFDTKLAGLIWKTEASLLLAGASYWLKLDNRIARLGAQWLNPFTMEVRLPIGQRAAPENVRFVQRVNGQQTGEWGPDEIVYFREFNPGDDIGPGIPAARVALGSAQLHDYATRFAGQFFAHGAMPTAIVGLPEGITEEERKSAEGFFKRAMSGMSKAFRILAVRGEVKHSVFTPPIKDLAMPELMGQARSQIGLAFGIPQTMLEDAANFATAKEHEMSFMTKTVRPRTHMYSEVINSQFLDRTDLRLEFAPDEMDIFQEDEAERSSSLVHLEGAGVPLKLAMEILGYDLSEEQWAELAKHEAEKPEPARFPFEPRNPNSFSERDDERQQDLRRWERKALKRMAEGKSADSIRFESKSIPAALMGAIEGGLWVARTSEDVKAIFAEAAHAR